MQIVKYQVLTRENLLRYQMDIDISHKHEIVHIFEEIQQSFQIQKKTKSLILEIDLVNEKIKSLYFLAEKYETYKSSKLSVEYKNSFHLENALKFRCEGNLLFIIKCMHQFNQFIIENKYTRITPYFLTNADIYHTFDVECIVCDIYACVSGNII